MRDRIKQLVQDAMPLLEANLQAANQEYLEGKISNGAFNYVLMRHAMACQILSDHDNDGETLWRSAATLTIDLQSICQDLKRDDFLNMWIEAFKKEGFTSTHSFLDYPVRPN